MLAIHQSRDGQVVYARDTDTMKEAAFDGRTGYRLSGNLDIPPDELLFLVWRQRQSTRYSDERLREVWRGRKLRSMED